jgi:hypothetical protein
MLLDDRALSDEMGAAGREHVLDHFLITRYLRDYLQIFNTLAAAQARSVRARPRQQRVRR